MAIFQEQSGLFQQRLEALYQTDADGRLVCTNEWEARPVPRFHLMRTAQGAFFRCQAGLPDEIVRRLEALCRQEPAARFSEPLPVHYEPYLAVLTEHAPIQKLWSGPAYRFLQEVAPQGETTFLTPQNADLLRDRMADWLPDVPHRQPFVAVVKDGAAVSVCASVRITDAVHCAGVETHPDYRHRGYALAAVARWANAVRAQGATPFYSTSWENRASQRIAQHLKTTLTAVDFHVT